MALIFYNGIVGPCFSSAYNLNNIYENWKKKMHDMLLHAVKIFTAVVSFSLVRVGKFSWPND